MKNFPHFWSFAQGTSGLPRKGQVMKGFDGFINAMNKKNELSIKWKIT